MTRTRSKKLARKKPEIVEYFKFRGKITVPAVLEVMNAAGIEFEPHEGQWPIIDAYEEREAPSEATVKMAAEHNLDLDFEYKYRCFIAACGRRFGKSEIAALLGAAEMLVPHAKVLIVSKTTENCEIIFTKVRQIILHLLGKDEIIADRERDMELELSNGASLRVAGKENVESKLGRALSLLILDEAKLYNKKLYEQILSPMLADYAPYSRTILISSPENNWFEDYYKRGQDQDNPYFKRYWSINLPTHSNPNISREWLEEQERILPRDLYEQEILGLFTSNAGLVCREFNKATHVYDPADYPHFDNWLTGGDSIIHMVDSGFSHYFGSAWVIYVEELDTYFTFGEYYKNKTITSLHAERLLEYEEEKGIEVAYRYADPAASQQIADFTEYGLYFNKAEKCLRETINNLNTLFYQTSEVTGKPRLLISKECPELIRQLSSIVWKEGRDDEQTKEKSSGDTKPFLPDKDGPVGGGSKTDWDLFDAFRYGMYSFAKTNRVDVAVLSDTVDNDDEFDPFEAMMYENGYIRSGLIY